MATPTSVRSFFGLAKRANICARQSDVQTFFRYQSTVPPVVERQLQNLGIDREEYKRVKREVKAAKSKAMKPPRTQKEAEERWEQLKNSPEHTAMLGVYKRGGVDAIQLAKERKVGLPGGEKPALASDTQKALDAVREPLNVKAVKLRPLRRSPEYGIPVCDLQLRTYSIRNMMLFADFAVRAAYYFGLPARGPVPLPRITERWTVPRANFIFKKSQENFERITMRRLIQIQDGHPDVVKMWLAFLTKHQYYGVGMKANIWEYERLEDVLKVGEKVQKSSVAGQLTEPTVRKIEEILASEGFAEAMNNRTVTVRT